MLGGPPFCGVYTLNREGQANAASAADNGERDHACMAVLDKAKEMMSVPG
jgi:hypothetical protein